MDFELISPLGRAPIVSGVNPAFPQGSEGLVTLAGAKPGTINFGSAGLASTTHLTAEQFKIPAGVDMTHGYRGGSPALNDVPPEDPHDLGHSHPGAATIPGRRARRSG